MRNKFQEIKRLIDNHYLTKDYPSLHHQIVEWGKSRPLEGMEILDSTPLFRNTLVKHLALMAAGANLTVAVSDVMPYDSSIVDFLQDIGSKVVTPKNVDKSYDIIMDCAGAFADVESRFGYVELTRSGVDKYKNVSKPVFVADSGKIKKIETVLGTGESLFRALSKLGYNKWSGRKIILFGSGKVGAGIVLYAGIVGAYITVVTDPLSVSDIISKKNIRIVDYQDTDAVCDVIKYADMIVCATGVKGAIKDKRVSESIINSGALLANMGVEDEFGEDIPTSLVLNEKRPLNFILDEPTHLRYIETTMALHNAGALFLTQNPELNGIISPPTDLENNLLDITISHGIISNEITMI